ncbi:Fe-S protein assembly co-chaperone HscB [Avibacterium endocarditidis]|uniref:Co-chaperone protein HscB homolog n=1 Tax=Avibacterium endocarditidis TaxID=380674 RepID=A0ABX4ZU34_9PAST|nr:Fe-S protein assembly co-chaperone HscB [Avibacterium endocarditidis]POY43041.1 Fe-S protein assembly co-chaperone HscB [Avibacterium endocarditidis]
MNNPFALFDLPVAFSLDLDLLNNRYLALQKSLHPDNFAHRSTQEQRLAMQKSAEVNDALQILKDPIARADSIIALHLGNQNVEEKTSQDMAFLMQQMQWREELEDIEQQKDSDALMQFSDQISAQRQEILILLNTALSAQDWAKAQMLTDRLRFIKKLLLEVERIEDNLMDF